jgi:putative oxidoreductase
MAHFIGHPAEPVSAHAADRIAAACSMVFYPFVALFLRLVAAHDFFLAGQAKVVGPSIPVAIKGFSYSVILPSQLRDETLNTFSTKFAGTPIAPAFAAYALTYAELLLPICLVIGFGTRVAALVLLAVTVVLQLYLDPEALWTAHVYWAAILLVLIVCGGGAISIDWLIRRLYLT